MLAISEIWITAKPVHRKLTISSPEDPSKEGMIRVKTPVARLFPT